MPCKTKIKSPKAHPFLEEKLAVGLSRMYKRERAQSTQSGSAMEEKRLKENNPPPALRIKKEPKEKTSGLSYFQERYFISHIFWESRASLSTKMPGT